MKALFDAAVAAAKPHRGDRRGFTLGAIAIRRDGKVVSSANGAAERPQPSSHAEARVLAKAGKGSTLIVARVRKNGTLGLAKPCPACQALIRSKEVEAVYYSVGDGATLFDCYYPGDE